MTTEIRLFALNSKKEKVLDRGQNDFKCEDNNDSNKKKCSTIEIMISYHK